MDKFIVEQITQTNWTNAPLEKELINKKFQAVINKNANLGYHLIEWKLTSEIYNTVLTETIIAIFELNS